MVEVSQSQPTDTFKTIVEAAPVAVVVYAGTRNVYINPSAAVIVGYPMDELMRMNFWDMVHPEYMELVKERGLARQRGESVPESYDIKIRTKQGDDRWLRINASGPIEYEGEPGILVIAADVTEQNNRRLEAEQARLERTRAEVRTEELQRSRTRILEVSESVRREIGGHLHSTVQNKLILLIHRLAELAKSESSDEIQSELQEIRIALKQIIDTDIRKISNQIYPTILERGIVPALQSLGDLFRPALNVSVKFDSELAETERSDSDHIPERVRLSAYRIAEEGLTNALKHAEATTVEVRLNRPTGNSLSVQIADDGRGFELVAEHKGMGLGVINDYADSVGGTCEVRSRPGKGTVVTANLPVVALGSQMR